MKYSLTQALLLAPLVNAFPAAIMMEAAAKDPELVARTLEFMEKRQDGADGATAIFEAIPSFDAAAQLIDVGPGSGHEWRAPGPRDLRGPCPGLNAFANHGFLPRNGYATVQQYIDATTEVVGMGSLLAGFLSILGGTLDGDLTAWSMGGTPPRGTGGLLGGIGGTLLGRGNGLSGSHNKYETDASPTRPDLYEEGNNFKTKVNQFQELIDFSPGGEVTLNSLTEFRSHRFDTQIANNPFFFNGPFAGVAVQPAAYTFIFRFMANHTEERPVGQLSYDTIASWFGIQGQPGSYSLTVPGGERIPNNWYRRSRTAPYELPYFLADLINAARLHPKFVSIGGNTGTTNSFAGVNREDLSGGLINAGNLLEGNNLGCFVFQLAAQAKPDVASNILGPITNLLGQVVSQLSCPQLRQIDDALLMQFPGYQRAAVYRR